MGSESLLQEAMSKLSDSEQQTKQWQQTAEQAKREAVTAQEGMSRAEDALRQAVAEGDYAKSELQRMHDTLDGMLQAQQGLDANRKYQELYKEALEGREVDASNISQLESKLAKALRSLHKLQNESAASAADQEEMRQKLLSLEERARRKIVKQQKDLAASALVLENSEAQSASLRESLEDAYDATACRREIEHLVDIVLYEVDKHSHTLAHKIRGLELRLQCVTDQVSHAKLIKRSQSSSLRRQSIARSQVAAALPTAEITEVMRSAKDDWLEHLDKSLKDANRASAQKIAKLEEVIELKDRRIAMLKEIVDNNQTANDAGKDQRDRLSLHHSVQQYTRQALMRGFCARNGSPVKQPEAAPNLTARSRV